MYQGYICHLLVIRNIKTFNVTAVNEVNYHETTREDNLKVVLRVLWE